MEGNVPNNIPSGSMDPHLIYREWLGKTLDAEVPASTRDLPGGGRHQQVLSGKLQCTVICGQLSEWFSKNTLEELQTFEAYVT